jgi:hypothetical protein
MALFECSIHPAPSDVTRHEHGEGFPFLMFMEFCIAASVSNFVSVANIIRHFASIGWSVSSELSGRVHIILAIAPIEQKARQTA